MKKNELIESLGFPAMTDVRSLLTIAHLVRDTKKRCGIYCLAFSDGQHYIGQAVDVTRRFVQHRHNYSDIVEFAYIPVPKAKLNTVEKELIYKAETLGVTLRNVVHVSSVVGDADLDLLLPVPEQDSWLEAVPNLSGVDSDSPKIMLPESQRARFAVNFENLCSNPLGSSAIALLGRYLIGCVPFPRLTEYSFWSVSCMPSTNKNTWPRLFCVNAASMELFVAGWDKETRSFWAFMTVDEDTLIKHWPDPEQFSKHFPFVEYFSRGYRDAGQSQITLRVTGEECMALLLTDAGVCKAAAALNLRVMRKRPNFYMQFHCAQLVNLALTSDTAKLASQ